MKLFITAVFTFVLITPAFAHGQQKKIVIIKKTTINQSTFNEMTETNSAPKFDGGPMLEAVVYETPNSEWGAQGSYNVRSGDTRVYGKGKIYLNRMFWQKK